MIHSKTRVDSNHNIKEMRKKQEKDLAEWTRAILEILWAVVMSFYFMFRDTIEFITQPRGKSLKGLHVLVTGGARGLGREICVELAKEGCSLTIVDVVSSEETARLAKGKGALSVEWRLCDITDRAAVLRLVQNLPPIDVLVNNAGIVSSASVLQVEDSHIERMMQVNVMAHFWTIRAILPGMIERGKGHIVAIASAAAFTAAANIVPYTATKYAVTGLMASLREELRLKHPKVKTTCVHPFFISPPPSSVEHWDKTCRLPDVTATEVARLTVRGIRREKPTVTVPSYLYFLLFLLHVIPSAAGDLWRDIFPARISSLPTEKPKEKPQ